MRFEKLKNDFCHVHPRINTWYLDTWGYMNVQKSYYLRNKIYFKVIYQQSTKNWKSIFQKTFSIFNFDDRKYEQKF